MKKLTVFILSLVCVLLLVGCNRDANESVTGDLPPMLIMDGEHYIANSMSVVSELSDDFECMGTITAEEANDTGLQGHKYYANRYISSFDEFYVYQECATPVDENTLDSTNLQWAYVKWVREGFNRS